MASDLDNMLKNIERWSDRKIAAAVGAVDEIAEIVRNEAKELVPYDTGFLEQSISKTDAAVVGNEIRAVVGANANYALIVHERMDVNYSKKTNQRAQAKFLETPILEMKNKAMPFIAEAIRNA